jgi:hypothetical protein
MTKPAQTLIELPSHEKPRELPAPEGAEPADRKGTWKALMQLKAILPYLSRLLPLVDARFLPLLDLVGAGHKQSAGASKETRENIASLQAGQNDLRTTVQEQSLEIKRLEEQIQRLQEASERGVRERAQLSEEIRSAQKVVRWLGAGLAILLLVVLVIAGVLLAHPRP